MGSDRGGGEESDEGEEGGEEEGKEDFGIGQVSGEQCWALIGQ